jgi:hypothetical protein
VVMVSGTNHGRRTLGWRVQLVSKLINGAPGQLRSRRFGVGRLPGNHVDPQIALRADAMWELPPEDGPVSWPRAFPSRVGVHP